MMIDAISFLNYWGLVVRARHADARHLATVALNTADEAALRRKGWKLDASRRLTRTVASSDLEELLVMYPHRAPNEGYRAIDDPAPGFWVYAQTELCLESFSDAGTNPHREWATNRYVRGIIECNSEQRRLGKAVHVRLDQMIRSGDSNALEELKRLLTAKKELERREAHRLRQRRYEERKTHQSVA
jgi:hypothetical protein